MSVSDVFRRITSALDQAGIGYMLSGSFATTFYGAPRSTQDIDLVIEATEAQLKAFVGGLASDKYYVDLDAALESLQHRSIFNVIDFETGWKIDLIIRKAREFSKEEFSRRQKASLQNVPLFVAGRGRHYLEARMDRRYLERWIAELGLQEQWNDSRTRPGIPD